MKLPVDIWTDPSFADASLKDLREAYADYLTGRENPASPQTVVKYRNSLLSFERSLEASKEPAVLAAMTPGAVRRWVSDQRKRGLSEEGIASRLTAVKVFTNKFVFKVSELTSRDMLEKVLRIRPKEREFPELTDEQQSRLLNCFSRGTFEDIRNHAMMAVYMATGLRFSAVLYIRLPDLDRVTGNCKVITKGDEWLLVRLSQNALREVRAYVKHRPDNKETDRLWLQEDGIPLGYWGAQSIFRRMKTRAGIKDLHAHLLRHNFAKKAARNGANRGELQDMLGHKTEAMTRRYLGNVAKEMAAWNTAKYSPI